MNFNVNLAACIEEAEHATEKATRELVKVTQRYDLTPDGIEGERKRLYAVATQTAEAAKARGVELIDAKIAELDAAEVKAAERRAAVPGGRSVRIEPANVNGQKQAHLQDVKKAFLRAMDKAAAYISPADLASGRIAWREEVEALRAYIVAQNEDFSKPDAEVWAAVIAKMPDAEVWAKAWQMRFTN